MLPFVVSHHVSLLFPWSVSSYCSLFSAPTLRIISCFSWSNTSIKLSMFCLEYFVASNLEHCKVSCHLGVRGGEAVLCSICCLAMFLRGCAALWSKLERLSIRESEKRAWKTPQSQQSAGCNIPEFYMTVERPQQHVPLCAEGSTLLPKCMALLEESSWTLPIEESNWSSSA